MITIKKSNGSQRLQTEINTGSRARAELMTADSITLSFSRSDAVALSVGDFVNLAGSEYNAYNFPAHLRKKYVLMSPYVPTYNETTGGYDYSVEMVAFFIAWNNRKIKFNPQQFGQEASWSLTGTIYEHLAVWANNVKTYAENVHFFADALNAGEVSFDVDDDVVTNEIRFIQYDGVGMFDFLGTLCGEDNFDCEWWYDASGFHFGKCEGSNTPRSIIATGSNANASVSVSQASGNYATRLLMFGGERNLTARYRKTLWFTSADMGAFDPSIKVMGQSLTGYSRVITDPNKTSICAGWFKKASQKAFAAVTSDVLLNYADNNVPASVIALYGVPDAKKKAEAFDLSGTSPVSFYPLDIYIGKPNSVNIAVTLQALTYEARAFMDFSGSAGDLQEAQVSAFAVSFYIVGKDPDGAETYKKFICTYYKTYEDDGFSSVKESRENEGGTFVTRTGEPIAKAETATLSVAGGDISAKTDRSRDDLDYYIRAVGHASVFAAEPSTRFLGYVSATIRAESGSKYVETTITTEGGQTIEAVFNPYSLQVNDDRSRYVAIKSAINDGTRYRFGEEMILGRASVGYFTDETSANAVVNSVAKRNLMLPATFWAKYGADGTIETSTSNNGGQKYENRNFIDTAANIDASAVIEAIETNDDYYPKATAKVGVVDLPEIITDEETDYEAAVSHYYYRLTSSTLQVTEDCILPAEILRARFETGALAGMEFDLNFSKRDGAPLYTIIPNQDYGLEFPNDITKPETGDEFVFINFDPLGLDDGGGEMIAQAEADLLEYATRRANEMVWGDMTATAVLFADIQQAGGTAWEIGTIVSVEDPRFSHRRSRVIGYDMALDIPADGLTLTIGQTKVFSRIKEIGAAVKKKTPTKLR